MAMKFLPGMTNVLEVLNQMWDAFAAGPYNALPLTGGNLTGPVTSTSQIAASAFIGGLSGVVATGTAGVPGWHRLGRLIADVGSSGRMVISGVNGYGSGTVAAGATTIHFRRENTGKINGLFYGETAGAAGILRVVVDDLWYVYVHTNTFFNGNVEVFGQFTFIPSYEFLGQVAAPSGTEFVKRYSLILGDSAIMAATEASVVMNVDYIGKRLLPALDNTYDVGQASTGYRTIYARTGTINTSDARLKCDFRDLTSAEIAAARDLARAIGVYRWRDAVECKGDGAREHIGPTVQRAIEIMQAHGLDPFNYGFICHDEWEQEAVEHPAVAAIPARDGHPATEARAAYTEVTREAGDRYGFRYDELAMFIAAGQEARLAALEALV